MKCLSRRPSRVLDKVFRIALATCLVATIFRTAAAPAQPPNSAPSPVIRDPGWPREFDRGGTKLTVYQPQIGTWERFRILTADTAVSVTEGGGKPVLGVISWRADTVPNLSTRTVTINDIQITSARFPSLDPAAAAAMERKATQTYPTAVLVISLDRILAGFKAAAAPRDSAPLNTEPPPVFISQSPAILLFVGGAPIRVPIQGTNLTYVVNTTWDLFYDNSDYYLLDGTLWLKAHEIDGPWTATTTLPPDMAKVPSGNNWQDVKKALPAKPGAGSAPKVFFTKKPAELLVFKGKPAYAPIPPTALTYATNTTSQVFTYSFDHQFYVLLSGRWFRAATLDGPWRYASNDLPDDFKRIPPNSPAGSVLASVPGTQQAHDAVLLAQVPTVAVVNKSQAEAKVNVQYTGEPKFAPIQNTSLACAVNTNDRVIKVGDMYYLCLQGVWFMSTTPSGPWKAADSVPRVIYTIPPSSPVYNVTYVTVSNPTPTTVESSYTPGYMGMFIMGFALGATVVYGTGYYYPPYFYPGPYVYPIYYPYPCSDGVGAVYHPYTGAYSYSQVVYGPYASAGRTAWYNPTTGAYGRAVTYQNAYGGSTYAQAYNPWTGTYGATQQHHNTYSQWGSSVVSTPYQTVNTQHYASTNGAVGSYQTSKGGSGAGAVGPGGQTIYHGTTNSGTQYAGKDGNVYKQNPDGTWSKYNNGSWTPVNTAQAQQQVQQRKGAANSMTGTEAESGYVPKNASNDVYAGKDGNIYKQGSNETWSRYENGGWNQVSTPTTPRQPTTSPANVQQGHWRGQNSASGRQADMLPDTFHQLNNESTARRQGEARDQDWNRNASRGSRTR